MSQRHALLKRYVFSTGGTLLNDKEQVKERAYFDSIKVRMFPLTNLYCYTCTAMAAHRHHVIPLCWNGAHTRRNLVGLCEKCHSQYEYKHKKPMVKKIARSQVRSNIAKQKVIRSGSLSRYSRIVYKP